MMEHRNIGTSAPRRVGTDPIPTPIPGPIPTPVHRGSKAPFSIVLLLALGACENYDHSSSHFSEYYKQPAESKSSRNLERKKILHWKTDPRAKALIGVLERNEITLEGSREPREHYVLYDAHLQPVGMITFEGKFYRYDEHGRRVLVNEYVIGDDPQRKMFMTGLKVFFGLPLSDNLGLEEIDPYGDF